MSINTLFVLGILEQYHIRKVTIKLSIHFQKWWDKVHYSLVPAIVTQVYIFIA